MDERKEKVNQVIQKYIRRKKGLVTMENIHARVFSESVRFTTWSQVDEWYADIDWDQETFQDFVLTAKEVVEGGLDRISEAYFEIKKPNNLTLSRVINELENSPYDEKANPDTEPDGFQYEVGEEEGIVHGTFIYTNVKTNIRATGTVWNNRSEDSINFRIIPDDELLIVESTYPPYIQKMKGAIRTKTGMAMVVCGSLTSDYETANERVKAFQDSFEVIDRGK